MEELMIIRKSSKCIFLFGVIAVLGFTSCNKDIENVKLSGYVYKGATPTPNLQLFIKNYYYEGGDHDGYMPAENYTVQTDQNGYYSLELVRSAYIQIDTIEEGYSTAFKDYYVHKRAIRVDLQID